MSEQESTLDEFIQKEPSDEVEFVETAAGRIPSDWDTENVGTLCKLRNGKATNHVDIGKKQYIVYGSNGPIGSHSEPNFDGGLIFGRVGAVGQVERVYNPVWVSDNAIQATVNDRCNTEFLYYFLSKEEMSALATKTAQPLLNQSTISNVSVPSPRLSEQRKIATVLHTVDQAIIKTEDILEKLRDTSSKIAQELAISGIGHSEFEKVRLGPKQVEVPTEWNISKFGDLSEVQQGLQIAKSERYREDAEGRYQYITVQYLNDPQDTANNWYIEEPRQTVICEKEDILMTRTGNTGEVITGVEGAFHNNFFKIEFDRELLLRDYLVHYLESKTIQDILISYAGTTTIPDLNHGEFFNIPVLLPPIDEQRDISEIIASMNNKVAHEERYLNSLQRLKRGLMQDLLSGTVRTTDTNITVSDEVAQHG